MHAPAAQIAQSGMHFLHLFHRRKELHMPSMTIHIADRGTPRADNTVAMVGHMWFTLENGAGKSKDYGFSQNRRITPANSHPIKKLFSKGEVYHDDSQTYLQTSLSKKILLSQEQFEKIKAFSDAPDKHGFEKQYNAFTNSCVDFVWIALRHAGITATSHDGDIWPKHNIDDVENIGKPVVPPAVLFPVDPFTGQPWPGIDNDHKSSSERSHGTGISITTARLARFSMKALMVDPLAIDLDHDGIETIGPSDRKPILFDHEGNGIKSGTGWLAPDDGWLTLDRDDNGEIDSGRELFGVDTLKKDGQPARDGFEALREFDQNIDGRIDAKDTVFEHLRIWRDLNQDGASQAEELTTLIQQGIVSINLNSIRDFHPLGNGNIQNAISTFFYTNGASGKVANIDLASAPFHRQFKQAITLTEQALLLPDVKGSGRIRDLSEAISIDRELGNFVAQYSAQNTRSAQVAMLDTLLEKWADTSDMSSLQSQAITLQGNATTLNYLLEGLEEDNWQRHRFLRILGIVERFMGFTYGGEDFHQSLTNPYQEEGDFTINLDSRKIESIEQTYEQLKNDIYQSLLPTTRLAAYSLLLVEGRLSGSFNALETQFSKAITENPLEGLTDFSEFIYAIARIDPMHFNWDVEIYLKKLEEHLISQTRPSSTRIEKLHAYLIDANRYWNAASHLNDLLLGSHLGDCIDGEKGNDLLIGNDGNDDLYGSTGNDTLEGGLGNDSLHGGPGNDIYLFSLGGGTDTIYNYDSFFPSDQTDTRADQDILLFQEGISSAEILALRNDNSLILKLKNTSDSVCISEFFFKDGNTPCALSEIRFSDGTSWSIDHVKKLVAIPTAKNDNLYGYQENDTIDGSDGDDSIHGNAGDDILIGGHGNDYLSGGDGGDLYIFGPGDGKDIIINTESTWNSSARDSEHDALLFRGGITPSDIRVLRNYDDLVLSMNSSDDSIHIIDYFYADGNSAAVLSEVRFQDGSTWSIEQVKQLANTPSQENDSLHGYAGNDILSGGDGDDDLNGYDGDDILDGGTGNDSLRGGRGNDLYRFGPGSGQDIIIQEWGGENETDILLLSEHITEEQIWLSRIGSDLQIKLLGSDDTMTVQNWFFRDTKRLEEIRLANGKHLMKADIGPLTQAMSSLPTPNGSIDSLPSEQRENVSALLATHWH